jgi:hypothetical protein
MNNVKYNDNISLNDVVGKLADAIILPRMLLPGERLILIADAVRILECYIDRQIRIQVEANKKL